MKSILEMYRVNHTTMVVWLALNDVSHQRGKRAFGVTRKQIAELCGIRTLKSISDALYFLEHGGWIVRAHVVERRGGLVVRTLRITLKRGVNNG